MRTCKTHNVTGIATYGDCPQCIKEQAHRDMAHSPEYMAKLLQNCEEHLAKATAALKAIFAATDPYADGAPDASAHDKLCNEISSLARPWARTHSENVPALPTASETPPNT